MHLIEELFRFQIKDDIKAVRRQATEAYCQYVDEPVTSQRQFACKLDREGAPEGEAVGLVKIAL